MHEGNVEAECGGRAHLRSEPSNRANHSPALALLHLRSQARFPLTDFRRGRIAEVLDFEHWSDLDLAFLFVRIGAALDPIQRLLERRHFPQPKPSDELLGLREGPVDDGAALARESHARALARGVQALASEHDPGLHQLLVELAHVGQELLARHLAGFRRLRGFDDHHDFHDWTSCVLRAAAGWRWFDWRLQPKDAGARCVPTFARKDYGAELGGSECRALSAPVRH